MIFTADRIDDNFGIWLGDLKAAENREALDHFGISHILTILDYQLKTRDQNRIYFHIDAEDFQSTDLLTKHFENAFQFIDQTIEQGHQVLIHCQAGLSRSATIAAMFLMKKYSLTVDEALQRLKTKRIHSAVTPNDGFLNQLNFFYQMNYQVDVESEVYQQFQRHRLKKVEEKKNDETSIVLWNNLSDHQYRCRSCDEKLFVTNDIQQHQRQSNIICDDPTTIFTFYLDWIEEIFHRPFDEIRCPNCRLVLGEYSLQGLRCSCSQWIKPAFRFQSQSIK